MLSTLMMTFFMAANLAYTGMVIASTPSNGTQRGVFSDWVDDHNFELRIHIPDGLPLKEVAPFVTTVYQHQFAGRSLVLISGVGSFTLHPSDPEWREFKRTDLEGEPNSRRLVSVTPNGDEMVVRIEWIE